MNKIAAMNNEITVTRACRIRTTLYGSIDTGSFYITNPADAPSRWMICHKGPYGDVQNHQVGDYFDLPYQIDLRQSFVVVFDSFDAMCRWVSNGRKLEDLQSDGKDEWIPALDMALGTYAEVVKPFGDLVKWDVVFRRNDDNFPILKVSTGFGYAGRTLGEESKLMVWPLGPGDSITITPRNP